ncbi:MAG: restriction endonuclease subunit S [Acidobacteriota bacterium]
MSEASFWPLPPSWTWTRVSALTDVIRGASPRPKGDTRYFGGDIPWIMIADVSRTRGKLLDCTRETVTEAGARKSRFLNAGTLILSNSGTVCVPKILSIDGCIHDGFVAFPSLQDLETKDFLYYWFESVRPRIVQENKQGVTQVNLNTTIVREIPVPLAPLTEQRRVVARIEELFSDLDAGVAALERVRGNLKRYRAALLKAAVEGRLTELWRRRNPPAEPASPLLQRILAQRRQKWEEQQLAQYEAKGKKPPKNWREKYKEPAAPNIRNLPELPVGWCWATVDQLSSYLRNGISKKPAVNPPGFHLLRINSVRAMVVDLRVFRYLDEPIEKVEQFLVQDDDLLFTRYNGSIDLLGVAGVVRSCNRPTLHPDKLIRVKAVLGSPLPAYLEVASNVGVSRAHIVERARTTAGQTGISGTDIREMPIPLCPLLEQVEILDTLENRLSPIADSANLAEASLRRASRLRQAILKQAFRGKLVPQDPNEEPADALLERLCAQRPPQPKRTRKRKSSSRHLSIPFQERA